MRFIGHGVDMVSIEWMKSELESTNNDWECQFFSTNERLEADEPPTHVRYFAGRFAGKEAVVKALGTGFTGEITWTGIEILRRENGAPYIRLSDAVKLLANNLGIKEWSISISYCGQIAIASVIAVGE